MSRFTSRSASRPASRRPFAPTGVAVLAVGLALALGGCGSDDEGPSAEPSADSPAASSASFVADANAVCRGVYADINAVTATLDPADPTGVTDDFLPLVIDLQDQLEALVPSEEAADAYGQALANQQDAIDAITADPAALFSLDDGPINDTFDSIGLTTCGSESSAVEPSRRGGTSAG